MTLAPPAQAHAHATIPSLDGIRAVSVAIVFFAHAGVSSLLPGGFGVTIFFFLSGFLITTLFYREAGRTGDIDIKAFYIRRLLRLSPPLLVTLGLTYLLVAAGLFEGVLDPAAFAAQVLYVYNYYALWAPDATEGALGLNVLWSLAVEEHFYLLYPLVFLGLLRGRLGMGHVVAMLAAILVWRIVRLTLLGSDGTALYMSTDTRIDSILYGAFLAILTAEGRAERLFPDAALPRWGWIAGAMAVLLVCLVWRDPEFRATFRYSLQGLALMPVFHYAVTRPDLMLFRPLNWGWMRMLGLYSYTIYLAHTVVLANLQAAGLAPENVLFAAFLALALCVAYAAALYRFVEQPVKALRGRLVVRRPDPA